MPKNRRVFITGGTGYIGSRLIPLLLERGHQVVALVRPGSEGKLPPGCTEIVGNALLGETYLRDAAKCDTFVQLVGVAHPSPSKGPEFLAIDQRSAMEAIRVAAELHVPHFVYLSVAHPAPAMHAYIAARSECEAKLRESGLCATILRPSYVLGPGHQWPRILMPLYWIMERIPSKRETALRLGLVTITQMVRSLASAIENPAQGVRVIEVPEIRNASL